MCKMLLNITKESWGKCGVKMVKYYNKKEDIIELQQKMSDVETQIKHSNIADAALKRIRTFQITRSYRIKKKIGYNHDNIMVQEETSIAEKIMKLFSDENIILNKNFNDRKPDIWFKNHNLIIEVDEGNHENYDSDDEKEREDMFKNHNFKIF